MKRRKRLGDARGWLSDHDITQKLQAISCRGFGSLGSQTEWLLLTPAEALFAASQPPAEAKKFRQQLTYTYLIVAPITKGGGVTADSGCHWSLVVAARQNLNDPFVVIHFDSAMSPHQYTERHPVVRLANTCGVDSSGVRKGRSGQQQNGYDCGIFVVLFAECVLEAAPQLHSSPSVEKWYVDLQAMMTMIQQKHADARRRAERWRLNNSGDNHPAVTRTPPKSISARPNKSQQPVVQMGNPNASPLATPSIQNPQPNAHLLQLMKICFLSWNKTKRVMTRCTHATEQTCCPEIVL